MKKICSSCGEERDVEQDFKWEYKDRGIRQSRCKYCQSELSKRHYHNNKQVYNERTRIIKKKILTENASHISAYLSTHPCVDCGQTDIRLLEFDHVHGQKSHGISNLFTSGFKKYVVRIAIV